MWCCVVCLHILLMGVVQRADVQVVLVLTTGGTAVMALRGWRSKRRCACRCACCRAGGSQGLQRCALCSAERQPCAAAGSAGGDDEATGLPTDPVAVTSTRQCCSGAAACTLFPKLGTHNVPRPRPWRALQTPQSPSTAHASPLPRLPAVRLA